MTSTIVHLEREPHRASGASLLEAPWSCPKGIPVLIAMVTANRPFHLMKVILHIPELHARSSRPEIPIAIPDQFLDLSRQVVFDSQIPRQELKIYKPTFLLYHSSETFS